jgi:hypothetical protein
MKFQKTLLASAVSLMLLNATGCGDSEGQDTQDDGATSFTGMVIDGRVARGFVWVDTDNDSTIDVYEPYAYTDSNGFYSYNPLTNTNYCDIDLDHEYCLNTAMVEGDFNIKIAGGVDLSTGEPFKGVMTLYSNLDDAKEVEQQVATASESSTSKPAFIPVVSPLTSLAGEGSATEKAEALTKLGLEDIDESNIDEILNTDYTDFDAEEEVAAKSGLAGKARPNFSRLFGYAVQYQKTVDTITTMLNKYLKKNGFDISKDTDGNPGVGSVSNFVQKAVRNYVKSLPAGTNTANVLASITQEDLLGIMNEAAALIPTRLIPTVVVIPESVAPSVNSSLQQVNNTIVNTILTAETPEDFQSSLLAAQIVVSTTEKQADSLLSDNDDVVNNALNEVNTIATAVQTEEFKAAIKSVSDNKQTIDVKQLADDLQSGKSISESVANSTLAEAPSSGEAGIWSQRALSMSGLSDAGEPGRILIFFDGEDVSSTSGDVSICYAFNANKNSEDVTATLLQGTWQELNTRGIVQLNDDLVSFTIKALKRAVLPANELDRFIGLDEQGADETTPYGHFRFVYDERQEVWYSDLAVEDTENKQDFGLIDASQVAVPTTPAQCETVLDGALYKNLGF